MLSGAKPARPDVQSRMDGALSEVGDLTTFFVKVSGERSTVGVVDKRRGMSQWGTCPPAVQEQPAVLESNRLRGLSEVSGKGRVCAPESLAKIRLGATDDERLHWRINRTVRESLHRSAGRKKGGGEEGRSKKVIEQVHQRFLV
jgi:hypothetical protein